MSIRHKSFKHGWFYHYRVHNPKAELLCSNGFVNLKQYLYGLFEHCPDDFFDKEPRSSSLKFSLDIHPKKVLHHEVSALAQEALELGKFNTAHTCVEMHMLQHDLSTISIEVPLWTQHPLVTGYFGTAIPLTGHIDLLRVEHDKVWIWDFKPNAEKEKFATTQTYFYALMLAERTGIPLEKFMCGYFDQQHAFVFKPEEKFMQLLKK
ncbi:MAG: PD-(D/E)XK nuclease family protein [archaeon]